MYARQRPLMVTPITITQATAFVATVHRRLPKLHRGLWACSLRGKHTSELLGVCVYRGLPVPYADDFHARTFACPTCCSSGGGA